MIQTEEVLHYLGIRGGQPDPETLQDVLAFSEELEHKITGRWVYEAFEIEAHLPDEVALKGFPASLKGRDIAALLAPCDRVYLMACTLGPQAERFISLKSHLSATKGLIADACASSLVEAWCDRCEAEIRSRAGNGLTFRYSPGYGDLTLEIQKPILEALVAHKRIGLALNDSYLLTPRKSIVAILGVLRDDLKSAAAENFVNSGNPASDAIHSEGQTAVTGNHRCGYKHCDLCPLNETCTFKK